MGRPEIEEDFTDIFADGLLDLNSNENKCKYTRPYFFIQYRIFLQI